MGSRALSRHVFQAHKMFNQRIILQECRSLRNTKTNVEGHIKYPPSTFCVLKYFSKYNRCYQENKPQVGKPPAQTTIDQEEVDKFSASAQSWWDEGGEFEALHTMNELRVPLISSSLMEQRAMRSGGEDKLFEAHSPLKGFKILDVGSGGGILSEPLARLGAFVVGVDASEEIIKIAQAHISENDDLAKNIKYICATVEDLVATEERSFDAVVLSEVIEHVADQQMFLKACCRLVKPGGSIFLTTINKTMSSYILGVVAAERFLHLVAPGTHHWNKFVNPQDVQYLLDHNGFATRLVHGMLYNPLNKRWKWIEDTSINYAIHAVCTDEALALD